jgi:hypothetical protein
MLMSAPKKLEDIVTQKKAFLESLNVFDANIWLGKPQGFPLAEEIKSCELSQRMKRYGIKKACISHWLGKTASAQDGNKALINISDSIDEQCRCIYTALPLFPEGFGPLPGPDMILPKFGGVRIFPRTNCFSATSWGLNSLCEWLIAKRIPLFIWHTEIDLENLYVLANSFPKLQIILESQPQKLIYHTCSVFALMKNCRNICLEISNLVAPGLLKYAVRQLGAQRFVYGSFLPANDPMVAVSLLLESGLDLNDINLIAGGNMQGIVGAIKC